MTSTVSANPQTSASSVRVVLIEDVREVRDGLSALISGTAGYDCVATYGRMETALARVVADLPDVILTDLGLPGMSESRESRV